MLKLYINGQQIELGQTKFTITIKNSLFLDGLNSAFVFSIPIPATPKNCRTFGFMNRIETYYQANRDYECQLFFNGILLERKSTLTVRSYGKGYYDCDIKLFSGDLFYSLKDLSLKDLDLGGDRAISGPPFDPVPNEFKTIAQGGYPDYHYTYYPIYNVDQFLGTAEDTMWRTNRGIINYFKETDFDRVTGDTTGGTFMPLVYVPYLIDRIFARVGYEIRENAFTSNPDLKGLTIYNNFTKFKRYDVGGGSYEVQTHNTINLVDNVPDYLITDFMKDLRLFGLNYWLVNNKVYIKFFKDVLLSPLYRDISAISSPVKEIEIDSIGGYKFGWSISNDDWASNYFKNNLDNYSVILSVATFDDLPVPSDVNDVCLVIDQRNYFIYRWDPDDEVFGWKFLCHDFLDLESGSSRLFTLVSELSPLMSRNIVFPEVSNERVCPHIQQRGSNNYYLNSDTQDLPINDPGIRLALYRGFINDGDFDYPIATNDVYDGYNVKIETANLALKWGGDYGLYNLLWKEYINWRMNTRLCTFNSVFSASDIITLDLSMKHRIKGVDFLIKEIRIPVTNGAILPATVQAYKV
jgi:hypothetical protein